MSSRIVDYLTKFSIVTPCQFGFHKSLSTADAITRVRSFWSRSLRSETLRSRSFGSEAKFGHFGCGHYGPGHFGRGHFCLYFRL